MQTTSSKELQSVVTRYRYELEMLRRMATLIERYDPRTSRNQENQTIGNALTESFALHARNFTEFLHFLPARGHVRAVQFFDESPDWETTRGTLPDALKDSIRMANEQIDNPLQEHENEWPITNILKELEETFEKFESLIHRKIMRSKAQHGTVSTNEVDALCN